MPQSKAGRYVRCINCLSGQEMNGICRICGHVDNPLLPGMVPDITGFPQPAAIVMLNDPEAQLIIGIVTSENSATVAEGMIISSDPVAGTQLAIGSAVAIVVSLGPAG